MDSTSCMLAAKGKTKQGKKSAAMASVKGKDQFATELEGALHIQEQEKIIAEVSIPLVLTPPAISAYFGFRNADIIDPGSARSNAGASWRLLTPTCFLSIPRSSRMQLSTAKVR